MAFRVETTTRAPQVHIVCQGHLDAEAVTAIERAWAVAVAAGLDPVIRVCRGVTVDRPAVARLAAYPVERLELESPFLRSWLEEVRAMRTRASAIGSEERTGSGSERQ
jgi:hypothetical protein